MGGSGASANGRGRFDLALREGHEELQRQRRKREEVMSVLPQPKSSRIDPAHCYILQLRTAE